MDRMVGQLMNQLTSVAALRGGALALGIASAFSMAPLALAQSTSMVAHYGDAVGHNDAIPAILSVEERDHYRNLFKAIDHEQWDRVLALLERHTDTVLHQVALAEYYTHANSP